MVDEKNRVNCAHTVEAVTVKTCDLCKEARTACVHTPCMHTSCIAMYAPDSAVLDGNHTAHIHVEETARYRDVLTAKFV